MVDSLNEKMRQRLRAECEGISVAHHLDTEIQRELCAHMEDKVLAYLSGREIVTFDDALILTRAHFGEPAVLKGLMCAVHAVDTRDTLARRLVAAMFAATLLSIVFMFTRGYMGRALTWIGVPAFPQTYLRWAGSLLMLWLCLSYWQRRLRTGNPPWFATWNAFRMASCLGIAILLRSALELRSAYFALAALSDSAPKQTGLSLTAGYTYLLIGSTCIYFLLLCLIWLWWCDRPPRLWQNLATTALVWIVYQGFLNPAFFPDYRRRVNSLLQRRPVRMEQTDSHEEGKIGVL